MLEVGDMVVYAAHGVCKIVHIGDKSFLGTTKEYYDLHPIDDDSLTLSVPVDSGASMLLKIMNPYNAEEIIQSFREPGVDWIDHNTQRIHAYQAIIHRGDREEISRVVNTLLRRKNEVELEGRKLPQADLKLLDAVRKNLFDELALAMKTSVDEVTRRIDRMLAAPAYSSKTS